eukprot:3172025-Amphidinium_carterae.1
MKWYKSDFSTDTSFEHCGRRQSMKHLFSKLQASSMKESDVLPRMCPPEAELWLKCSGVLALASMRKSSWKSAGSR